MKICSTRYSADVLLHVLINLLGPCSGVSAWSVSTSSLVKGRHMQPSKRIRGTATCVIRRMRLVYWGVAPTGPAVSRTSLQIITTKILWVMHLFFFKAVNPTNSLPEGVFLSYVSHFLPSLSLSVLCFRTHQSITPQSWWRRGSPFVSCRYLTA